MTLGLNSPRSLVRRYPGFVAVRGLTQPSAETRDLFRPGTLLTLLLLEQVYDMRWRRFERGVLLLLTVVLAIVSLIGFATGHIALGAGAGVVDAVSGARLGFKR